MQSWNKAWVIVRSALFVGWLPEFEDALRMLKGPECVDQTPAVQGRLDKTENLESASFGLCVCVCVCVWIHVFVIWM